MSWIEGTIDGIVEWANDFGWIGLAVYALLAAAILPVPTEAVFIPIILLGPSLAWAAVLVVTLSSVVGGTLCFLLGHYFGERILGKLEQNKRSQHIQLRAQQFVGRYGAWTVFGAAFTPLPYNVFSVGSGFFRMPLISYLLASLAGRGLRFGLEAVGAYFFGEHVIDLFTSELLAVFIAVGAGVIILVIRYSPRKKRTTENEKRTTENE